jgi:hypothetical protein
MDLVPLCRLRRPRAAVDRLDAHAPHRRRAVRPTRLVAFGTQRAPEHPAGREGMVETRLVDPAHRGELGVRGRARQVVDAAPADPERLGPPRRAEPMSAVDHRPAAEAADRPCRARRTEKRPPANSPILACSVFTPTAGGASTAGAAPKTPDAPSRSCAPLRDQVGVDVEPPAQPGQRLLTLDRLQGHLRLEGRAAVAPRSPRPALSSASASCRSRTDHPLDRPVRIPRPLSASPTPRRLDGGQSGSTWPDRPEGGLRSGRSYPCLSNVLPEAGKAPIEERRNRRRRWTPRDRSRAALATGHAA